ncbi:MAG: hypothetical protein D6761_00865 [Candidatus Dadabacteria bacterium]|nr:MAG: hypothetical protein D6761_00865 [Candidatus Dadabacteria bacterium]
MTATERLSKIPIRAVANLVYTEYAHGRPNCKSAPGGRSSGAVESVFAVIYHGGVPPAESCRDARATLIRDNATGRFSSLCLPAP